MLTPIEFGKLNKGLIDGVDEHATPRGAFIKSEGFEYRRGYPYTVSGRSKLTSSEIRASKRVRDIERWVRADETERYYALIDGGLFQGTSPAAAATLVSLIKLDYTPGTGAERAVTATRNGNVVTFGGTYPKALLTVQVGDCFYYNADGTSTGEGVVASVDSDTQVTLTSYTGASSGTFGIWRKFTDDASGRTIIAGDRIWVFSTGTRPHWYDGTIFREAGLPAPASKMAIVLVAGGGGLSAGDYFWSYAYEDKDGRLGDVVTSPTYTAAVDDRARLSGIKNGPAWATKVSIFRPIANGTLAYCIHPNVTAKLATSTYSSPSSTLTLAADSGALVTHMHIRRYVKFATSGTSYLITANNATTLTVTGDASSATGGESGTDDISITGGLDIDEFVNAGASIYDYVADADLDYDYEAPSHQAQPPSGLIYPHLFLGGGRLCAYEDTTQTKVWFSGRSTFASTQTGDATAGLGEFDYWTTSHYAGRQEGDEIQGFVNIGPRVFALKERSIWELYHEPIDVIEYSWFPRTDAVGCLSPLSIVSQQGVCYFLGQQGQEADVIRFDGNEAYGMFRAMDYRLGGSRLRVTLDSINVTKFTEVTGALFEGRLYVSFPAATATTNSKTLRFDFKTFTADVQPWGCGVFAEPYYDSTDGFVLLCGEPRDLGYVFDVLGTAQDNGSDIGRTLITGRLNYPGVPTKARWAEVFLRVVNSETLTTAPVIQYSIDQYVFSSGSKTWQDTMYGEDWPTAIGEQVIRKRIEVGENAEDLVLKITSTDAETWGVKEIEVRAVPYDQHHGMLIGMVADNATQYLLVDGSRELSSGWDAGPYEITAETFRSDVETGVAPFAVASTTAITNLNADLLDGQEGAFYLDSTNFTGTDWTDLTDAGETALHIHDARYYTETEIDGIVADYLPLAGGVMTGNITMPEDGWIGITGPAERLVFDGTGGVIAVTGADLLIPSSAKVYFDAGASSGTEYITSGADTILSYVTGGRHEFTGGPVYVGSGSPGHTITGPGDCYIADRLEVDGETHLDGALYRYAIERVQGDQINYYWQDTGGYPSGGIWAYHFLDQVLFWANERLGRQWVFGAVYGVDYDHAVQTNPTIFVHSATAPDDANDEWISLTHNVTNGVIALGSGQLYIGPTANQEAAAAKWHVTTTGTEYANSDDAGYYDIHAATGVHINATLTLSSNLIMPEDGVIGLGVGAAGLGFDSTLSQINVYFADINFGTNKAQFRDSAIYIASNDDSFLDLIADGGVRIGDGGTTDYVSISATGLQKFVGTAGVPHAEMWVLGNAVATTIAGAGTFAQFVGFANNGNALDAVPDHTQDHITITTAGKYLVVCSFHVESIGAGAADVVSIEIRKENGTVVFSNLHAHRKLAGGGGDIGSISISGIADLNATDTLEVWLTNDDNATDILVADANMSVVMVGGT